MTAPGRYALSNAHAGAPAMHDCLSGVLDVNTTELLADYLSAEEHFMPADSRTLLLGAGNGSMALWLGRCRGRPAPGGGGWSAAGRCGWRWCIWP